MEAIDSDDLHRGTEADYDNKGILLCHRRIKTARVCTCIPCFLHTSATALRHMLVDDGGADDQEEQLDLSNAVPGHIVAYEDMENDLLLVGDLNWKDFTRVARRIRIIPVRKNSLKGKRT